MLWKVIISKSILFKMKVYGIFYLLNSIMFLSVLVVVFLSIFMLYIKNEYVYLKMYFIVMSFFVLSMLIFFICYWYIFKKIYGGGFMKFIEYVGMFFIFFFIVMGFFVYNIVVVLEGYFGKKSEFICILKFNLSSLKDNWRFNKYLRKGVLVNVIIEGVLMFYFVFGMYSVFIVGN